jgi:hypothetical protein
MKAGAVATVVVLLALGATAIAIGAPRWNENDSDGTAQALGRLLTVSGVLVAGCAIAIAFRVSWRRARR